MLARAAVGSREMGGAGNTGETSGACNEQSCISRAPLFPHMGCCSIGWDNISGKCSVDVILNNQPVLSSEQLRASFNNGFQFWTYKLFATWHEEISEHLSASYFSLEENRDPLI